MPERKNIDVEFKAADDGTFVALASVFNNVDRVGDRMLPGAFKDSLASWRASGKMLPVILSHNWNDIAAHIGYADPKDVRETSKGLEVKAHLDTKESDVARRVHTLMKRGQLTAMSFGYSVPSGGQELDEEGINEVGEVELHEVGPTLVGANAEAQLQAVKSALEAEALPPANQADQLSEEKLRKAAETAERDQIAARLTPAEQVEKSARPAAEIEMIRYIIEALSEMDADELAATKALIDQKAVWTTAYINGLPDSAFLYVESGGEKDGDGKTTPRSLRHFPYRDAGGAVDLPHLRNALSRIPQSNLPQEVKDRLARKAEGILDQSKAVAIEDGVENEEPAAAKSHPQDPLRARSLEAVLDMSAGPRIARPSEKQTPVPKPPSEKDLRRRSRDLELDLLT